VKVQGCQASKNYACISGYTPSQVPNLATLADDFAISDRTFSMADSPSWGGHLYAAMGQLDGFEGNNPKPDKGVPAGPGWGCDSNKITQWTGQGGAVQWVPSCIPDYSLGLQNGGAFEPTPVSSAPTILDRLGNAGLSWRIYGEPKPDTGGTQSGGTSGTSAPRSRNAWTPGRRRTTSPVRRSSATPSTGTCRTSPSSRPAGKTLRSASTTASRSRPVTTGSARWRPRS
jgi:hypothetical protein